MTPPFPDLSHPMGPDTTRHRRCLAGGRPRVKVVFGKDIRRVFGGLRIRGLYYSLML